MEAEAEAGGPETDRIPTPAGSGTSGGGSGGRWREAESARSMTTRVRRRVGRWRVRRDEIGTAEAGRARAHDQLAEEGGGGGRRRRRTELAVLELVGVLNF